jgi:malonyl CoA-acyl carrier protein transacylase
MGNMPTPGKLAIAFPGQGSQTPGMRDEVEAQRPDLLRLACDAVGDDPFVRASEGTRFAQPAIFCASLAGWERLRRPEPDVLAGHSLGEVTALVVAGSLAEEDGLRVVAARGRLMQEAADTSGGGGMLAVRASRAQVEKVAALHGLTVANENEPRQVVLSGARGALETAANVLGEAGIRCKLLPIRGAFHSPAMAGAVPPFRALLGEVEFRKPRTPVLCCATAEPFDDPRARLAQAITSPVRWLEVAHALYRLGARRFLDAGPGRVLAGLIGRTLDGVEVHVATDLEPAGV